MLKEALSDDRSDQPAPNLEEDAIAPDLIREELRRIVISRHFRTSRRGKEFLQYVVDQKISGNGDLLKERLIGVHLFGRKPDYATGEDPVVRVQAGDVRRRLESYHADPDVQSDILIQIPVGSYAPVFLLRRGFQPDETSLGTVAPSTHAKTEPSEVIYALPKVVNETDASTSAGPGSDALPASGLEDHQPETALNPTRKRRRWHLVIPALACVALAVYLVMSYIHKSPESTQKLSGYLLHYRRNQY